MHVVNVYDKYDQTENKKTHTHQIEIKLFEKEKNHLNSVSNGNLILPFPYGHYADQNPVISILRQT